MEVRRFCLTIALVVVLLVGAYWLFVRRSSTVKPNTPVRQTIVPVVDLPKLALHTRTEVEKSLGKPTKYTRRHGKGDYGDEADYAWGTLSYNQSRLIRLTYKFVKQPEDEDAFRLLNLPLTNQPHVGGPNQPHVMPSGTRIWDDRPLAFHTGYRCCETFAPENIFISGNREVGWEMVVVILDLDDPRGWTDEQCSMYVKRTGLPLPDAAKFRGSLIDRPITLDMLRPHRHSERSRIHSSREK